MTKYRITFTPMEPYFLGNEKTFKYPGQENDGKYGNLYFIRSEQTPSQSTLLGALRYMLLSVKRPDFSYTAEEMKLNAAAVGSAGFDISSPVVQDFGAIRKLSPVYITCGSKVLIPAPLDHNTGAAMDGDTEKYAPFSDYAEMTTPYGKKLYARDYDSKKGIAEDKYLDLDSHAVVDGSDIFLKTVRIGINRAAEKKGLFKKEFCSLADGYSFAVDAEIDESILSDNAAAVINSGTTVYLGQNKSVFSVSFSTADESIEDLVKESLKEYRHEQGSMIYVLGETMAFKDMYEGTLWANVTVRDYRAYKRDLSRGGKVEKGSNLYRLIRAGSVFLAEEPDEWINRLKAADGYENAEQIGYCSVVVIGG